MMSFLEIIARLIAILILAGYLLHKRRQRELDWRPEPQDPAQWNGKPLDITPLMPSIERLREDYLGMPHSVIHEAPRRQRRIALARRALGRLSYFCDGRTKNEVVEDLPLAQS